jgi:hypothetical protein
MNSFAKTCLILAAVVATGTLFCRVSDCAADNRFSSMQQAVEGQIERIKASQERAVERLELSTDRPFEQLQRSEEDLIRQIEILERIREQVQEQMREADSASRLTIPEAAQELCAALSEVEVQLGAAKALVKRLEAARLEAESRAAGRGASTDATPAEGCWNVPCGAGGTSAETDLTSYVNAVPVPVDPVLPPPLPPRGG